ncbi:MAG: hypothetical protein M3123_05000 [Actinomycetota bacterium]|nr:hypothetical protein [Actinomycetota bacterium]
MERAARSRDRAYATAVADLWERLGKGLARLDRIADAAPDGMGASATDELRSLQYSLHAAAELALGIRPPLGAETAHTELVAALSQARDATAEVAAALEADDGVLVENLLPEWRGALFRVRLARLRALERSPLQLPRAEASEERRVRPVRRARRSTAAAVAIGLVAVGAVLFTAGAVLAAWPLWAAGLVLFAGGLVLFRP